MAQSRAAELVRRYGRDAVSFQALTTEARFWFGDDDACVAYTEVGGAWVTIGGPVAPADRELAVAEAFVRHARAQGRRVRFFGMERPVERDAPLAQVHIGEQPVWDVEHWPKGLPKKLRYKLRRAHAQGLVTTREVDRAELAQPSSSVRCGIDAVARSWLASRRMAPMGFLVRLDLYARADERRFFVAEHEGKVVGVIIAMPVYGRAGWTFETFLRTEASPFFTMELLFDRAVRTFAAEGSKYVTYGLCPLSGTSSRLFAAIRWGGRPFYRFDGLRQFKGKLKPDAWNPVFLGYPKPDHALAALTDALRAFLPGGYVRFALHTLARRRKALVKAAATRVSALWVKASRDEASASSPLPALGPSPAAVSAAALTDAALPPPPRRAPLAASVATPPAERHPAPP